MNKKKKAIIVGGGPSGLMAAWTLAGQFEVHLFEKEKGVGQKFLLAGKGGMNLTNRLTGESLFEKYMPSGFLTPALKAFDSLKFRVWLSSIGIPTFEGSSGRIFPEKGITPARVLKQITSALESKGVVFHMKHRLNTFNSQMDFVFESPDGEVSFQTDYAVLALGGASWPSTGSDGRWMSMFVMHQIRTLEFQSSNCGINICWPDGVKKFHTGKPLKNVEISINQVISRGEALITDYGLEGNAVYPLIPEIRKAFSSNKKPVISIDFKPFNTIEQLIKKAGAGNLKPSSYLKVFNLNPMSLSVIKAFSDKNTYTDTGTFISSLKKLPVPVESLRPVEEAISVVGGLSTDEIDPDFSLKKFPQIYAIGEMIDWDAPTGGFLLQGSFSMGYFAAQAILGIEKLQPAF